MKIAKWTLIGLLMAAVFSTADAAPKHREHYSTDPKKDLKQISVEGTVEKISGQKAVVRTDQGEKVTVHLGPRWYWQEKGYRLESGTRVRVSGWGEDYDGDGGFIFAGDIYGDGFHFEFMNSEGYPYWADPDDWGPGWYPRGPRYEVYFFAPPWAYAPPPWWGHWHHYWGGHHHWRPRWGRGCGW